MQKLFPVAIYYKNLKLNNSNDFTVGFITETKQNLITDTILNNINIKIKINMFVYNALARAFLLKIKDHSGFSLCTR